MLHPSDWHRKGKFLLCANSPTLSHGNQDFVKNSRRLETPQSCLIPFFQSRWPCTWIQTQQNSSFPFPWPPMKKGDRNHITYSKNCSSVSSVTVWAHGTSSTLTIKIFGVHVLQPRFQGQAAAPAGLPRIWAKTSSHLRSVWGKNEKNIKQLCQQLQWLFSYFSPSFSSSPGIAAQLSSSPHVPSLHHSLAYFHWKTIESLTLQKISKTT